MLLQFDLKHIHKVNFYPSNNNFTQALLVLLVTNMISVCVSGVYKPGPDHFSPSCFHPPSPPSNASLGHYIGPIGKGEEMQRSSQTDSPEGTLCCIFCDFRD